jgi:hypothetical protein
MIKLIIGILLFFCIEVGAQQPVCKEIRVALVGDSLMSGAWFAGSLYNFFLVNDWYEWDWDADFETGANVYIDAFTRSGHEVSSLSGELSDALGRFKSTHVVLYGGINNCVRYGNSPEKNAKNVVTGLVWFIQHVRNHGAEVIVVKHHPWKGSWRNKKNKGWECSLLVNDWIDGEALMVDGAQIVDTSSLGFGELLAEQYDAGDGLHLNRLGQTALAQIIQKQIGWQNDRL